MKVNFKGYDVECSPVELLALLTENAKSVVASTAAECGVKQMPTFDKPKPEKKPEQKSNFELTPKEAEAWGEALTEPEHVPVNFKKGKKKVIVKSNCCGHENTDWFYNLNDFYRVCGLNKSDFAPHWKLAERERMQYYAKRIAKYYLAGESVVSSVTLYRNGTDYTFAGEELK